MSLKDLQIQLGNRIRIQRKQLRITQARLAECVGLARTSIVNIENGRQMLTLRTMYRISVALGLGLQLVDEVRPLRRLSVDLKRNLSTPKNRAFWKSVDERAAIVKKRPAWKRGGVPTPAKPAAKEE